MTFQTGNRKTTVEAGSGKIFHADSEALQLEMLARNTLGSASQIPELSKRVMSLNPVEQRLVADRMKADGVREWMQIQTDRDPAGNVLNMEFRAVADVIASPGTTLQIDATNGRIFDRDAEARKILGNALKGLGGDSAASKFASEALSVFGVGELTAVTSAMSSMMQGRGYIEKIPGRTGRTEALRFVSNGHRLLIDLTAPFSK